MATDIGDRQRIIEICRRNTLAKKIIDLLDMIFTSGHVIQNEGISLPQRPNLNFRGSHVFASDNGTDTTEVDVFGNVDGGFANSVYLISQNIDGGGA